MTPRSRQSRRKAPPPRPGEPPRPPAPLGRTLVAMIARGDPEALILAEYQTELARYLYAEKFTSKKFISLALFIEACEEPGMWL